MNRLIADYFSINKSRCGSDFFRLGFFLLLAQLGLMIELPVTKHVSYPIYINIAMAVLLLIISATFVGAIGILDAFLRGTRLARGAGMTVDEYVRSEGYRLQGKTSLRRNDSKRRWLRK
jgi:hypothetical protein